MTDQQSPFADGQQAQHPQEPSLNPQLSAPAAVSNQSCGQATKQATKHYHLMGIGGIGMSAFARLLSEQGHRVSGCDSQASAQVQALMARGIPVLLGHDPSHISHNWGAHGPIDILIASEAVPKTHPEIQAAQQAGVTLQRRMSLLGEFLQAGPSIGIIGTHGKTTTTSMTAIAMLGAGLDPSAFIGGNVEAFDGNARLGTGPFVAEVDESDRAFALLGAQTAVFLNAEDDHIGGVRGGNQATYWHSVEEQHAGFVRFVQQSERVLYNKDWPQLQQMCAGAAQRLTFGFDDSADYCALNVQADTRGTTFELHHQGQLLLSARVNVPGKHNVLNALAALSVVHLYGGNLQAAAEALADFTGPARRWQLIGTLNGAQIIDDYAHNPTKVASAIEGARQTGKRVRVIFQPHRYVRTEQSWPRLADALMLADEVLLLDIAAASEAPIEGIHATLISERMQANGHTGVRYYPERAEVLAALRQSAGPNDLIVTMGAGDVWQLAQQLAEQPEPHPEQAQAAEQLQGQAQPSSRKTVGQP